MSGMRKVVVHLCRSPKSRLGNDKNELKAAANRAWTGLCAKFGTKPGNHREFPKDWFQFGSERRSFEISKIQETIWKNPP